MKLYDELKARGLVAQITDEEIIDVINEGKATFYIGFDATADSLHVGHLLQILIIRRMHSPSFIPGRQKCSASHGRYNFAVLLIHAGHISFSCKTQPVWIHGLGRAADARLKNVLQRLSRAMKIFIV